MARNPDNKATFNTIDQSGERSGFSLHVASGTMDLSAIPATWTNLVTALDDELVDWTPVNYIANITRKLATVDVGQGNREDKVEIKYQDNTNFATYTVEVPCRKGGLATEVGSDIIPAATYPTTKTAFEALARSPDGNAVTLLSARIVGRNV
jgi:hypothetical protein